MTDEELKERFDRLEKKIDSHSEISWFGVWFACIVALLMMKGCSL